MVTRISARLALACAVTVGLAAPASATITKVGSTFVAISAPARGTAVAFGNGVYLVVAAFGQGSLRGRFIKDGAPLGLPFGIQASGNYAHFPRVAWSPDADGGAGAFLVSWAETELDLPGQANALHVRMVNQAHGGPYGPDNRITGTIPFQESGAAIAYSSVSKEFLVVWQNLVARVGGARFDNSANLIGRINFPAVIDGERDPSVSYNPVTNQFIVLYSGYNNSYAFTAYRRIQAGTGAILDDPRVDLFHSRGTYITDISYNSTTNTFLAMWYSLGAYSRVINADGTFGTDVTPVSTLFSAYDALSLAYSPVTKSTLMVSHSNNWEDGGIEINASGAPMTTGSYLTDAGGPTGNFYPRAAASTTAADWLFSTAHNYTSAWVQVVSGVAAGPPPPPPCPVTLSRTATTFDRAGDSGAVTLTAGCSWTAASSASWLTLTSAASGTAGSAGVAYTATANNGGTARVATVTVRTSASSATLTVTQPGVPLSGIAGMPVMLWQNRSTGSLEAWFMGGVSGGTSSLNDGVSLGTTGDPDWVLVGRGDFDNDSQPDLLFQNRTDGRLQIWFMNGTRVVSISTFTIFTDLNWRAVGVGDFNRDGYADIMWEHEAEALLRVTYMRGATMLSSAPLSIPYVADASWKVAAVSDMDGDASHYPDLVLQNLRTGALEIWILANNVVTDTLAVNPSTYGDLSWMIVGVVDADGDGRVNDLVWQKQGVSPAPIQIWTMSGVSSTDRASVVALNPDARSSAWAYAAPRFRSVHLNKDFNNDGRADLLMYRSTTGSVLAWYMSSCALCTTYRAITSGGLGTVPDTTWRPVGVGDFNLDGRTDVLWRNSVTRAFSVWLMDDSNVIDVAAIRNPDISVTNNPAWDVVGAYDFDGDGKVDILFQNRSNGAVLVWKMNGLTRTTSIRFSADHSDDLNWRIVGTADVDGDGKQDLVWWNSSTGDLQVWLMNGATQLSSQAFVDPARLRDTAWKPVAVGDFRGDGKYGLIWQHDDGRLFVMFMNGLSMTSSDYLAPSAVDPSWRIFAGR